MSMTGPYEVGDKVLIKNSDEVCTVVYPEDGRSPHFGVWVHVPSRGYASDYALHNVRPLDSESN